MMRDVLDDVLRRADAGESVAVATVVSAWGSAPRPPGSSMLVGADGSVHGSVSGGCVDGDVLAVAEEVRETGAPALRRYGVSDNLAGTVGLTCGGTIEVLVSRPGTQDIDALRAAARTLAADGPVALVTVVEHPDQGVVGRRLTRTTRLVGSTGGERLDRHLDEDVLGLIATGRTAELTYGPDGNRQGTGVRVLVDSAVPPARLVVVGVNDFAVALARLGAATGRVVTVVEARPVFAERARRAGLDVVRSWPDAFLAGEAAEGRLDGRAAVVVLTHDPKFDVPTLTVALDLDVAFVGAMGSRRTHADRLGRLRAAGVSEAALARLRSPVGLDLGARTPEETAVSVLAEIVAQAAGACCRPLSETSGPIHAGSRRVPSGYGVPAGPVR